MLNNTMSNYKSHNSNIMNFKINLLLSAGKTNGFKIKFYASKKDLTNINYEISTHFTPVTTSTLTNFNNNTKTQSKSTNNSLTILNNSNHT